MPYLDETACNDQVFDYEGLHDLRSNISIVGHVMKAVPELTR